MPTRKKLNPVEVARRRAGLSGYALAKRVGITATHLKDIERGAQPRAQLAVRIAVALGTTVEQLFGERLAS